MKKFLFFIVVLFALVQPVAAQDTIYGRSPNYYYMDWYDECEEFYQPPDTGSRYDWTCFHRFNGGADPFFRGRFQHTDHRLLVKGLSAMVSIDLMDQCTHPQWPGGDSVVLPEYLFFYRRKGWHDTIIPGSSDTLILLDSVRWDTLTPKIMKLPKNNDTSLGYLYCYAYEAMFKEPIVVDGDFFIAGSDYSNRNGHESNGMWIPHPPHKTVMYVTIDAGVRDPYPHSAVEAQTRCVYSSVDPYWWSSQYVDPFVIDWVLLESEGSRICIMMRGYGPFHAIIVTDSSMLEVESVDEEMGTVTGGGIFLDSLTYDIEAVPNIGYKFTHWNDGDTANPRAVFLTQDTLFTAYFAPREQYEVVAVSSDNARGSVYGGGIYYEEDTATLTARAWGENVFAQWDDGDTANPRQIIVTQDTAFTALFRNPEGIEVIQGSGLYMRIEPNPTDGKVNVSLSSPLRYEMKLTLQDVAGHEVLATQIPAGQTSVGLLLNHLPAGVYYVTLHHPDGIATQKIVIK